MILNQVFGTLRSLVDEIVFPSGLIDPADLPGFLDNVFVVDYRADGDGNGPGGHLTLAVPQQLGLGIPASGGTRLLVGDPVDDWTLVAASFEAGTQSALTLHDISFTLRFSAQVLEPVTRITEADGTARYVRDQSREFVDVEVAKTTLRIGAQDGAGLDTKLVLDLPRPVRVAGTDLVIDSETTKLLFSLGGEHKSLGIQWHENNVNGWLKRVSSVLVDDQAPIGAILTLRLLLGQGVEEIRLDWQIQGTGRTFTLPGVSIQTPDNPAFTLLYSGHSLALVLTVEGGGKFDAHSTFAWTRDEGDGQQRELQNDDGRRQQEPDPDKEALFRVTLTANARVSVVLMQVDLLARGLPSFFQELKDPLDMLDFSAGGSGLRQPTPFQPGALKRDHWTGKFRLGLEGGLANFKLPFLRMDDPTGPFSQYIQIEPPAQPESDLQFDPATVSFALKVRVKFGSIELATDVGFKFGLETFALDVDHKGGIDFYSKEQYLPSKDGAYQHMGLNWRFEGAPAGNQGFRFFTLTTDKYAYELQQAQGSSLTIEYTQASKEPIRFAVTRFSLSPKGVSLTADVCDDPVRLNGIDTRFRFAGSRLVIVENKIADLTLAGSGPLPPDLVGDAMVDIALQFQQREGNLVLRAGAARLRGNKLLDCKGTRFQFSIDSIGLAFVNENGYHLYFKLTGSAQFKLAPGDDREGALAWLPNIKIELVDAPLTGDVSVLKKHIKFLIELPKPKSFNLLGCFEMEVRGVGFIPSADEFGGDPAMELSGQVRFAHGPGDTPDPRTDYHEMLIGLPEPGHILPRVHFKRLALNLNVGAAFRLNGFVEFLDGPTIKGFQGEGSLELQGMPSIAASFSFVRVRRDENSTWLRAWFIYIEIRRFSVMIPYIQIYLREVGLGFGYRYTLASIKVADRENDLRKLLGELNKLSRTQGDLSHVDRWGVDIEEPGEDVRWTIVLRALISQTSAAPAPLKYDAAAEKDLPCLFLIDAIIAFRSDLTFFMAARAWINTNYYTFDSKGDEVKERPFFSGFVLLSARQKRFLAHVSSNKEGYIGDNPPLPDLVKTALRGIRFSATLLIQPGLLHLELGWPNMLGWDMQIGPLKAVCRGGFIFRVSSEEFVIGISYESRGSLSVSAEVDLYIIGARVSATAEVGWGARLIALIKFGQGFFIYGAIGIELRITLSVEIWIAIPLIFTTIKKTFGFSLDVGFTAGLEAAITGDGLGVRGRGKIWLSAMGHTFELSASFGFNDGVVDTAQRETAHVLDLGLEATDVQPVPGLEAASTKALGFAALPAGMAPFAVAAAPKPDGFQIPGYTVFVIREPRSDGWSHLVLLPQGENGAGRETGFLPAPPLSLRLKLHFFSQELNRRHLPAALAGFFTGPYALAAAKPVVVQQSSTYWIMSDDSAGRRRRYDIRLSADDHADPNARLAMTVREQSDLKAGDLHVSAASAKPEDLAAAIKGATAAHDAAISDASLLTVEIRAQQQSAKGWLYTWRVRYPGDVQNPPALYEVITRQPVASPAGNNPGPVDVNIDLWKITAENGLAVAGGQPITLTPGDGIYADLHSYQLANGQAPDEVSEYLPAAFTVAETASAGGPSWVMTDSANGRRYLWNRATDNGPAGPELRYMDVRLEIEHDFSLRMPQTSDEFFSALEQYEPAQGVWVDRLPAARAGNAFEWQVQWDAALYEGQEYASQPVDLGDEGQVKSQNEQLRNSAPSPVSIGLGRYLRHAFKLAPFKNALGNADPDRLDQVVPVGDPEPLPVAERLEDSRVQNPSDAAWEAAVRGAMEQFEGSPFFKLDPNSDYDRRLSQAFQPVNGTNGDAPPPTGQELQEAQSRDQAVQVRGMAVHDIIVDLRRYAGEQDGDFQVASSLPFQAGLVFRYRGTPPRWLNDIPAPGDGMRIRQRRGPQANELDPEEKPVRTFNIWQTDFSQNSPQFQRVRHYAASTTIAITWDLVWSNLPAEQATAAQGNPEHHLLHYRVYRRTLDGSERDVVYTVKDADTLHAPQGAAVITRLRPRFQVVDQFPAQASGSAELPATGRSYLYTITPIDFEGHAGRPLTLVATRRPDAPPLVPVDGELVVAYRIDSQILNANNAAAAATPQVVMPAEVSVQWTDPGDRRDGPNVPVGIYRLVFRREKTLPIGSYGLDSETQRPPSQSLPTSNARPLPTDIMIELDQVADQIGAPGKMAVIPAARLVSAGILPGDGRWRPESWRAFFQTISVNGVPSALAPVQLLLRAQPPAGAGREERRPAELEWLALPMSFGLLPAEDQAAVPGMAHFPMPTGGASGHDFRLQPGLGNVAFRSHPAGIRCVRFRWNQGPSDRPDYPLDLNAGYHLLELDVDAQTTETFQHSDQLSQALRTIQEVQMLPAEGLLLTPGDTLTTSQWESWYPSAMRRLRTPEQMRERRSQTHFGPWASWRESVLEWPSAGLLDAEGPLLFSVSTNGQAQRERPIHPFLSAVATVLGRSYTVDIQSLPPLQPTTLAGFMAGTSPEVDPYGWKVLQHFGLSTAISLRDPRTRAIVSGPTVLPSVAEALVTGLLELALNGCARPAVVAANNATLLADYDKAVATAIGAAAQALKDGDELQTAVAGAFNNAKLLPFAAAVPLYSEIRDACARLLRHLHVEVLFQPARSVALAPQPAGDADMLAIIQLSLRPAARQYLRYSVLSLKAAAKASLVVRIQLGKSAGGQEVPCSYIDLGDPASGQIELKPVDGKPINRPVTFTMNGETALLFRSEVTPQVVLALPLPNTATFAAPAGITDQVSFVAAADGQPARLEIRPTFAGVIAELRGQVVTALDEKDRPAAAVLLTLIPSALTEVPPYDEAASTHFVVPETLPAALSDPQGSNGGLSWLQLKHYLESLNGEANPKIVLPTQVAGNDGIEKLLPDFLAWSQRFFDQGGLPVNQAGLDATGPGPWLATAYPCAGSPAYATPDEGGRLRYDHVYADNWAHDYRYYIQPYGRYDRLWHSFRQSPALSPTGPLPDAGLTQPQPDPEAGGLDVVIDRTQPVDAPLILASHRLDAPSIPGSQVPPGKIWEVIIAQHPEQALIERNQTLVRQIAFRQVAFTLLRRHSDEAWLVGFNQVLSSQSAAPGATPVEVRPVVQAAPPALPGAYPDKPDHLDLAGPVSAEDVRSIGLPARLRQFQQGALVLQWEGLPFYYQHRLLAFAQTAGPVSEINEVTQNDFEYTTPQVNPVIDGQVIKEAFTEGREEATALNLPGFDSSVPGPNALPIRIQRLVLPLKRFWDSLPPSAQSRWPDEEPDPPDSTEPKRKFSSLPDPEVVYQVIEVYQGNLEVQFEIFHGKVASGGQLVSRYQVRQLGRSALAALDSLRIVPPAAPHGSFRLEAGMARVTPLPFAADYPDMPDALTLSLVTLQGQTFAVGALTRPQFTAWAGLINQHIAAAATDDEREKHRRNLAQMQALYAAWTHSEPVSSLPDGQQLPPDVTAAVEITEDPVIHLVWDAALSDGAANGQPMSDSEKAALLGITGDQAFIGAFRRLVADSEKGPYRHAYTADVPLPVNELDNTLLPAGFSFAPAGPGSYVLAYTGILLDAARAAALPALYGWAQLPELRGAVDNLLVQLDTTGCGVPLSHTCPSPGGLPPALQGVLAQVDHTLSWTGATTPDLLQSLAEYATSCSGTDYGLAVANLHTSLQRGVSLVATLPAGAVVPATLPDILNGRLQVDTSVSPEQLRWLGRAPADAERAALTGLIGDANLDAGFRAAVAALLGAIDTVPAVAMPAGALPAGALDPFADRDIGNVERFFAIDTVANTVAWVGPTPDDVTRTVLAGVIDDESMPPRFAAALHHLMAVVDAATEVVLPGLPVSPLPQLTITDDGLEWRGRLHTAEEQAALDSLSGLGDSDFAAAGAALATALRNNVISVTVQVADRPAALPPVLAGKLMVSRLVLRYTGLMTRAEGQALSDAFTAALNKHAVQRLYDAGANPTVGGRQLQLRTRRGAARPSEMTGFYAVPLQGN